MALVNQSVQALAEAHVMFFSSGFSINRGHNSFGKGLNISATTTARAQAKNFTNDYFISYVTNDPITVYRVWGGNSKEKARWFFSEKTKSLITNTTDAQNVLKLYKNNATYMTKFEIPAGTRINVGGIKGGANDAIQIFIDANELMKVKQIGQAVKIK